MDTLLEIIGGIIVTLFGWTAVKQDNLSKQMNDKVDKSELDELRCDVKEILNMVTQMKVENAEWRGLIRGSQARSKQGLS